MDYRSFYAWSQSGFVAYGTSAVLATTLIFLWGILVGPVSVVWSTWVAGKAPEQAETAGGLFIASIQLAAAVGALSGWSTHCIYRQNASVFSKSVTRLCTARPSQ